MDIRPGSTLAGPNGTTIRIESFLGNGTFGDVFAGVLSDSTLVAVKTVRTASLTNEELEDFRKEAELAAQLNHPNVVRVLYFNDGAIGGGNPPYIVMELLGGSSLRGTIQSHQSQRKHFDKDELLAMCLQIARGMEAVNAKLVHRDIKPENILVDSTTSQLKISDFGLAKLVGAATRSRTHKGGGTLPYMAPEAFDGRPNTIAMDIYGVGVILHELSALDIPIRAVGRDYAAWHRAHLLTTPADLSALRSDLPPRMVQLLIRMLHKDPSQRPASWSEIIEQLTKGAAPAIAGIPDVSALVDRATKNLVTKMEADSRAQDARDREQLRTEVLQQAFDAPIQALRRVVDAYNDATSIDKLEVKQLLPGGLEVAGSTGRQKLNLGMQIIKDTPIASLGVARVLGGAVINPGPTAREALGQDARMFTGFNLVYLVRQPEDRFGSWRQIRFEINPLMRIAGARGWFALGLQELERQLSLLNAVGQYQHQQRELDDSWFLDLLHWLV